MLGDCFVAPPAFSRQLLAMTEEEDPFAVCEIASSRHALGRAASRNDGDGDPGNTYTHLIKQKTSGKIRRSYL